MHTTTHTHSNTDTNMCTQTHTNDSCVWESHSMADQWPSGEGEEVLLTAVCVSPYLSLSLFPSLSPSLSLSLSLPPAPTFSLSRSLSVPAICLSIPSSPVVSVGPLAVMATAVLFVFFLTGTIV